MSELSESDETEVDIASIVVPELQFIASLNKVASHTLRGDRA